MSLVQITDLVELPIVDLDTGDVLGQVASWVVSPHDQKILAYVLKRQSWLSPVRVLLTMDVAEYAPEMLVVRNPESIINPKDVVGLTELIDAHMSLVGLKAEDELGNSLGKVSQLVFEKTTSLIQRYYVQPVGFAGIVEHNLILGRDQVLKIDDKKIVFTIESKTTSRALGTVKSTGLI